ncbi:MAG: hypothetical protein JHD02_09085 [Thermoleophilaceae bacterium]|nr:hypothetical protein [Thermoleophilaceae bacterium]
MHSHTVMIRARAETRDALKELAVSRGSTAIDTLDQLVAEAHESSLLAALATSLVADAKAIAADTRALDAVAADGLNPADDFSDW